MGYLLSKILPPAGRAGSGDFGGVSMHQSWGRQKISLAAAGYFDGSCGS